MKKSFLLVLSLLCTPLAYAEFYKVNVKRIDSNLYQTNDKRVLIVTKYCYEYAYWENAILQYEKNSYDNKIIFENGQTCEVKDVYSK
ncbi:MAG: hypothetical protein Q4D05_07160 [Acinetobacter sp.]|nr:hypothetical protein [Acinetobacter sp.]